MDITRQTPAADLPELLTVDELCSWLGIGCGLGYDMLRRDELPSVKLGRLLRVPRAAVVALANGEKLAR